MVAFTKFVAVAELDGGGGQRIPCHGIQNLITKANVILFISLGVVWSSDGAPKHYVVYKTDAI